MYEPGLVKEDKAIRSLLRPIHTVVFSITWQY
jgi:hypothetical protein